MALFLPHPNQNVVPHLIIVVVFIAFNTYWDIRHRDTCECDHHAESQ